MGDFTNRQLAEIISVVSDKLKKTTNDTIRAVNKAEVVNEELKNTLNGLNRQAENLKSIVYEPDFSRLDKRYEEATDKAVNLVNKRLKTSETHFKIFYTSVVLFLISFGVLFYCFENWSKSERDILNEYNKTHKTVSNEDFEFIQKSLEFFDRNPKIKQQFLKWQNQ